MKKILIISAFALMFLMTSCSDPMVGSWVIPGTNYTKEQGFELKKDGTAEAINMDLIELSSWEKVNDTLLLNGKYTGQAYNGEFTDAMVIVGVTDEELKLQSGNSTLTYKKKEFK